MAVPMAGAPPPPPGPVLLSMKEIKNRDTFSGVKEDFAAWAFTFEADVSQLGWGSEVAAAVAHPNVIDKSALNARLEAVGSNLYLWLSQRMKGGALTHVMLVENGHGFEALRLIYAEYKTKGQAANHSMLSIIIQPSWWTKGANASRPFLSNLVDWERLVVDYEAATKERISEGIKLSLIHI